jgi:hypothetical protein
MSSRASSRTSYPISSIWCKKTELRSHNGSTFLYQKASNLRIWSRNANCVGRSMRSCQAMFASLMNSRSTETYPPSATSASPYPQMHQTRVFTEPATLQHIPRAIQPRPARSTDSPAPASTNGEGFTIVRTVGPEFGVEKRKKRGRPTKEEAEERDRLLAAEGKIYEPKKRPSKKFRASTGTPIPVTGEPSNASPSSQTPAKTVEPREDSSSGKRRLRRQASGLSIHPPGQPASPMRRVGEEPSERMAESPSDRLLARISERGPGERSVSGDPSGRQPASHPPPAQPQHHPPPPPAPP